MGDSFVPRARRFFARGEALPLLLIALMAVARVVAVFVYNVDSDETQHLHVAWGWAHGLMQYRDVFDNHTPLFHLAMAPLVALLGERADILIWMRLAMVPMSLVTLWALFRLWDHLFGRRLALWAVLIVGAMPPFLRESVQFRTDGMWIMFWALAMWTWFGGPASRRRAFGGGVLFGLAACSSLKTLGMLTGIGAAFGLLLAGVPEWRAAWRGRLGLVALALVGLAIPPACVVGGFWAAGALHPLVYCTVLHNIVPNNKYTHFRTDRLVPLAGLVILIWAAREVARRPLLRGRGLRAAAVLAIAGGYNAAMHLFWPVLQQQTLFSLYVFYLPGLVASVALGLRRWRPAAARRHWRVTLRRAIPLGVGLAELAMVWIVVVRCAAAALPEEPALADSVRVDRVVESGYPMQVDAFLDDVLRLTDMKDPVLDAKGESVFRRRPYYYVLEHFTIKRLDDDLLRDTIAQRLVRTQTHVVVPRGDRYPDDLKSFLDANYLRAGRLLVAGQRLRPEGAAGEQRYRLSNRIAGRYSFLENSREVSPIVDGKQVNGDTYLTTGTHDILMKTEMPRTLDVIWAQAVRRGFLPGNQGEQN